MDLQKWWHDVSHARINSGTTPVKAATTRTNDATIIATTTPRGDNKFHCSSLSAYIPEKTLRQYDFDISIFGTLIIIGKINALY